MQSGILTAKELMKIIKEHIVIINGWEYMWSCGKIRIEVPRKGYAYITEEFFVENFGDTPIPYRTKY